jgi:molybdopterin/thiamine biosynthesis adenylyltransferase
MDALQTFLRDRAEGHLVHEDVLEEAARVFTCHPSLVERAALKSGLLPARYQRNRNTLSIEQQLAISLTRVAVIGCGGLGGYVIEELARLGVGTLIAVDPDCFEEHNLNRQILSTLDTLGDPKALTAAERVSNINSAVTVIPVQKALSYHNAAEILTECDVVVDALDSIPARIELARFCAEQSIPLVHGAIAGWYGQLAVQMPGEKNVLNFLSNYGVKSGIEKEIGNPAFAPAIVAALQVAEVCKIITNKDKAMSGQILFIDLLNMSFDKMRID